MKTKGYSVCGFHGNFITLVRNLRVITFLQNRETEKKCFGGLRGSGARFERIRERTGMRRKEGNLQQP